MISRKEEAQDGLGCIEFEGGQLGKSSEAREEEEDCFSILDGGTLGKLS